METAKRACVMPLEEAAALIEDGSTIGVGGFGIGGHPMALLYQLVRQEARELTVLGITNGNDADLLAGAGCLRRLETAAVSLPVAIAPRWYGGVMRAAYTIEELMAVAIARDLKDRETGLTGLASGGRTGVLAVGMPLAAMGLAQHMHAPNLTIFCGGVIVNPRLEEMPTLFESGAALHRLWAMARVTPEYIFGLIRRGEIDCGFSTSAQIDRYGNINITCLGPYEKPRVRLVGLVLQTEHGSQCGREYVVMEHRQRSFVNSVDFITGVGYLNGAHAREHDGLKASGPRFVVTELAVLGFNAATKRMQLESLHPMADELDILRHRVNPHGRLLPRQVSSSRRLGHQSTNRSTVRAAR